MLLVSGMIKLIASFPFSLFVEEFFAFFSLDPFFLWCGTWCCLLVWAKISRKVPLLGLVRWRWGKICLITC